MTFKIPLTAIPLLFRCHITPVYRFCACPDISIISDRLNELIGNCRASLLQTFENPRCHVSRRMHLFAAVGSVGLSSSSTPYHVPSPPFGQDPYTAMKVSLSLFLFLTIVPILAATNLRGDVTTNAEEVSRRTANINDQRRKSILPCLRLTFLPLSLAYEGTGVWWTR